VAAFSPLADGVILKVYLAVENASDLTHVSMVTDDSASPEDAD
jgi:hypothetical protein